MTKVRMVILAAGKSKRVMTNKSLLPIGDYTILQRFVRMAIRSGISEILITLNKSNEKAIWRSLKDLTMFDVFPINFENAGYEILSNKANNTKIIIPHNLIKDNTLVTVGDIVCSEDTACSIFDLHKHVNECSGFGCTKPNDWQPTKALFGYYVKKSQNFYKYLSQLCEAWNGNPEIVEVAECADIDYIEDYIRVLQLLKAKGEI